jgi:hypothetical protein
MDPDRKAEWVAALRSGEYVQGRDALHVRHGGVSRFCCLGVACDLAEKAGIVRADESTVFRGRTRYVAVEDATDGSGSLLPIAVADWLGVSRNPLVTREGRPASLSTLNDMNIPFSIIADLIEEQL